MLPYLFLDAGNTVVFLDMEVVAEVARAHGHDVSGAALARVEGVAKRRYEAHLQGGASHEDGWGLYLATLLCEVGVEPSAARGLVPALRAVHDDFNLWRRVPSDLLPALDRWREAGGRVSIISNSEGMLPQLFARLGILDRFEVIVDSHDERVRKPDPELFRRALVRVGVAAADAVYLGDIPAVDVEGAHAAGMRAVLIDPLDFYPAHTGSPRVPSVGAFIDATLASRASSASVTAPGDSAT